VAVDPVKAWRGTAGEGLECLRVLHVGDCGIRCMESSHDPSGPIGFPSVAAERLRAAGVGLEFSHYFAVNYDRLPDMERLKRVSKLSGDPDVILVQLGATYGRRVVISDTRRVMQVRYDLARRMHPRLLRGWYRVLRPWVRLVGRHDSVYPGPAPLERALIDLRRTWPSATLVLLKTFPRSFIYPTAVPIMARVEADAQATAERLGLPFLDFDQELGRDPKLRCTAGYNLNASGSELVGQRLAQWLLERRIERETEATTSTG
jgi:hypothetical protein